MESTARLHSQYNATVPQILHFGKSQPLHRLNININMTQLYEGRSSTHSGRLRRDIIRDTINTGHLVRNPSRNALQHLRRESEPKRRIISTQLRKSTSPSSLPVSCHEVFGFYGAESDDLIVERDMECQVQIAFLKELVPTCSYVLISPITPTAFTGRRTAKAWAILSYNSALRISSM